ncbi:MAG: hypothetical protein HY721_03485 [Planctomycetes bacterium]|nr:hypothetical protein [Planctomycetota bacterium]
MDFRPAEGRSKLKVEVENVPPDTRFEVWIENPATGELEEATILRASGEGEAEVELETRDGAPLPFGVSDVSLLFGRPIEVRLEGGSVKFTGEVPGS